MSREMCRRGCLESEGWGWAIFSWTRSRQSIWESNYQNPPPGPSNIFQEGNLLEGSESSTWFYVLHWLPSAKPIFIFTTKTTQRKGIIVPWSPWEEFLVDFWDFLWCGASRFKCNWPVLLCYAKAFVSVSSLYVYDLPQTVFGPQTVQLKKQETHPDTPCMPYMPTLGWFQGSM